MKRVFLYVRVSTEEQALHGLSIEAQTQALQSWAGSNGHEVAGLYVDAGISARKPAAKRPELQRLLADVRAGRGELVAFTKLDRWFRNIAEYYKVQEVLEACRVDWRTIQEDYDTSTASGRLKVNIMLSVAQDEADRTSERIKTVFAAKRAKGEPLTGQMPFGYVLSGKSIAKDPDTRELVDEVFRAFLATGSVAMAQRAASERFGVSLGYQRVDKMLRSTAYCGRYFGADGMTPPYLTRAQFDQIQALRRRLVRKTAHDRVYLFSGLVSCGACGRRMGGRVNTKQESYFYNCAAHYGGAGCPNGVNLGERRIEAALLRAIDRRMARWRVEADAVRPAQQDRDRRGEAAALRSKLARLKELYVNELITLEEYRADRADYQARLDALEREADRRERPDPEGALRLLGLRWDEVYRGAGREHKQVFWRMLVKEIRIFPDRRMEFDFNG